MKNKDKRCIVPTYLSIYCGIRTVHLLIENGDSLDMQNEDGETALYQAIYFSDMEGARLLIKKGASLDIKNTEGNTALHMAISNSEIESIRLLIQSGANTDIKNAEGQTPIQQATSDIGDIQSSAAILGGNPDEIERARQHRIEVTKLLIMHNAEINLSDLDSEQCQIVESAILLLANDVKSCLAKQSLVVTSAEECGVSGLNLPSCEQFPKGLNLSQRTLCALTTCISSDNELAFKSSYLGRCAQAAHEVEVNQPRWDMRGFLVQKRSMRRDMWLHQGFFPVVEEVKAGEVEDSKIDATVVSCPSV